MEVELVYPAATSRAHYYLGQVAYLQDTYGRDIIARGEGRIGIACASSGILTSTILVCDLCAHEIQADMKVRFARGMEGMNAVQRYNAIYELLRALCDDHIGHDESVAALATGIVRVQVTKLLPLPPFVKSITETRWRTRVEYMRTMMRTMHIPFLARRPETWRVGELFSRGALYVDGITVPQPAAPTSLTCAGAVQRIVLDIDETRGDEFKGRFYIPQHEPENMDRLFNAGYSDAATLVDWAPLERALGCYRDHD